MHHTLLLTIVQTTVSWEETERWSERETETGIKCMFHRQAGGTMGGKTGDIGNRICSWWKVSYFLGLKLSEKQFSASV